jgi:hypothetical protein
MVSSHGGARLNRGAVVESLARDHVNLKIQVYRTRNRLKESLRIVNPDTEDGPLRHYDPDKQIS